ncbi:MAG: bifunctional UDP-N-acetylglucosamine diphosphorylase/glucosamine-1-phosphate N-acetyltransferase GlmU [Thermodesulfobacteriota bacterium]
MDNPTRSHSLVSVVLAAGKGTRMKSDRPKVLHEVFFAPMVHHVLDALAGLELSKTLVVTGHGGAEVEAALLGYRPIFVRQERQDGTGHAVMCCEEHLGRHQGQVLILCGDTPLIRAETLQRFVSGHQQANAVLSVMTTVVENPTNYGRIITDQQGNPVAIVEEKDASSDQRSIREINAGIYCVETEFLLRALRRLTPDNKQGELYLTDIVGIAVQEGLPVSRFVCPDDSEVLGVNSRRELARAHAILQRRCLDALMDSGVTILQPETVTIDKEVSMGRDSLVSPCVFLAGRCRIGAGVTIGPFCHVESSEIGDGARIGSHAHLAGATIAAGAIVPPHTVLVKG